MKGDFSRWDLITEPNTAGVLYQQGRVSLDRDPNDQTRLSLEWQDRAARDIIGPGVAAIPAHAPDGFRVTRARVAGDRVLLDVTPGHGWADGLAVRLPDDPAAPGADISRVVAYLQPPIQDPPAEVVTIGDGVRDAVVLEVWREALNGFQAPELLIEPALGGPDTTERVLTAMRFRLFRLGADDTCDNLGARIQDDPAAQGRLHATLLPPVVIGGDCPVVAGGGYTGFEHFLYRIEIAQINAAQPMFKWSQFNGGLVGRGECDLGGPNRKILLQANDQAIKMSGLSDFYLEVIEFDVNAGFWRVTYGAEVTLNGDDLDVVTERYTEAARPVGRVFFRLWNGIRALADFPRVVAPAQPVELRDGIHLQFDAVAGANYLPGDYWTFIVRAGEADNPDPLVDNRPPEGVVHHRVPLAILNWNAARDVTYAAAEIEDCRDVFEPLTHTSGCCTFRVGDGKTSFGDFNSIEAALAHLPAAGGQICVLPGLHEANVLIQDRVNVRITGCGRDSIVSPRPGQRASPIFTVRDSQAVLIGDLDMITFEGAGVLMTTDQPGALRDITVAGNRILALRNAISVRLGQEIHIHHNVIRMLDKEGGEVAIFVMADDALVERNDIAVVPAGTVPPDQPPGGGGRPPDPADPCAEIEVLYATPVYYVTYAGFIWTYGVAAAPANPYLAPGGIQVGSGSERVVVLENRIRGGAGNGVTLGSDLTLPAPGEGVAPAPDEGLRLTNVGDMLWGVVWEADQPKRDIGLVFTPEDGGRPLTATTGETGVFSVWADPGVYTVQLTTPGYRLVSFEAVDDVEFGVHWDLRIEPVEIVVDFADMLAFLYDIVIERNVIGFMGLSGIGVPRLDDKALRLIAGQLGAKRELAMLAILLGIFGVAGGVTAGLTIRENHISHCLLGEAPEPPRGVARAGAGGIALGLCENVVIRENQIVDNGADYREAICGVFIAYAEQADISANRVLNNGSITGGFEGAPRPGQRGGIVVRLALARSALSRLDDHGMAAGAVTEMAVASRTLALGSSVRHAVRVHDNLVHHPLGRALTILALGPVSVQHNQFTTDVAGIGDLDRLAGAVLVLDLGQQPYLARALGGSALAVAGGSVLFSHNQTLLNFGGECAVSQFILTMDDLGFAGNQSNVVIAPALAINTALFAVTVRASENRLQEPIRGG